MKELATWYLSQINQNFLYEFLFFSEFEIRYIVVGLIIEALKSNTIIQVGISVIEQLCFFVGKKSLVPSYKIIQAAVKINKAYEKFLKEINIAEIVMLHLKNGPNKEVKNVKQN